MLRSPDQKPYKKTGLPEPTIIFFIVTRVIAILFSYPCISDISLYFNYLNETLRGLSPYSGFAFEYPPLALLAIYIPGIFTWYNPEITYYFLSFAVLMFCVDAACLKLCRVYCRNRLNMGKQEINYMTLLYGLFGFLLFRLLYHRLDMVVALFFALSLLLFEAGKKQLGIKFFLNSLLGFFYKIVPAFILPVAIIFKGRSAKKIILDSAIFLFIVTCIIAAWQIHTGGAFLKNLAIHRIRGIHIESSIGSFLLFKDLLLNKAAPIYNICSWDVHAPRLLELVAKNLGMLVLLGFYGTLFLLRRRIRVSEELFLDAVLIVILLLLSFQAVLSPQFFIWLIPLASIWLSKKRSVKYLLVFCFLFFATFFIFSINYVALVNQAPILVATLFLRNLVMVITTLVLTWNFFKKLHFYGEKKSRN